MTGGVGWGAIVTLAIFVISNIAALIYWSARISTILTIVQNELKDLTVEFKAMRNTYVSKEEFAYRNANADKEHAAMWREIDRAKTRHVESDPT